jgi:8-oxo-dGTP diphosphatase
MMKHYVLGLVFDANANQLLLIEKLRPEWQAGRWNGIGGKIEEGETPLEAMQRESTEEINRNYIFEHRITFTCPGGTVFVFVTHSNENNHIYYEQVEDEKLAVFPLSGLPVGLMNNMKWIIPLCLANVQFPIMIEQLCLGVDG